MIIFQTDGGALKIYSTSGAVATVDPVFDRVIFFWSDRRNPHEVMPAFRERFSKHIIFSSSFYGLLSGSLSQFGTLTREKKILKRINKFD